MPSSVESINPITESDCCGNGCVNCVLDAKSAVRLLSKHPHTQELGDVLELHFRCDQFASKATDYVLDIPPGHHIMMRAPLSQDTDNTKYHLRPYSPFWTDAIAMEFKIVVNLKPQGLMSRYILGLGIGDEIEFRGPIGNHMHQPNSDGTKSICIVTQGVAVAPTLRIVEEILQNDDDMTRICHLACFTDLRHVYFREQLHDFSKYWNYKGRIYLARQPCVDNCCTDRCSELCDNFRKCLRYKEAVFLRRINEAEISGASDCGSGTEPLFIVGGSRDFQRAIVEAIGRMDICVKDENIILL